MISLSAIMLRGQKADDVRLAQTCHQKATSFYNKTNPTDQTDSLAFMYYRRALRYAPPGPVSARLVFDCHEKIGIYQQTYHNQREALASYRRAITHAKQYRLLDSLLFIPYLYAGSAHFYQQDYDSTAYYFEQAERLFRRYPRVPQAQRLFNSLGVLYHETGNYRQSINYFQKALQLQLAKREINTSSVYSYKSNIATALRNLHQYDSAAVIYKSLIPLTDDPNALYTNLWLVYLKKRQPDQALTYLQKVRIDSANGILIRNALAETYLHQARFNMAESSLQQSLALTRQRLRNAAGHRLRNNQVGLTYKLLGDVQRQQRRPEKALPFYHQSIMELAFGFNSTNLHQNPQQYSQGFSSYLLFDCLVDKADCWRMLHHQRPSEQHRQAAIDAYLSAFRLADYIEKLFDNDEARLFTVQKVFPVYKQAVAFLMQAHDETGKATYLDEAFRWSEKSKAAVLAIGQKENALKSVAGIPDTLLSRERNLRLNLSRLLIKLENAVDPEETQTLTNQLRDTELHLSRLTDQLNDYPDYYRLKFSFDSVNVAHLQERILGPRTALLSYFWTDSTLFGFVLTKRHLRSFRVATSPSLHGALRGLAAQLRTVTPGQAFGGRADTETLHDRLIGPAEAYLGGIESLIIVPHDELTLLPFEALHDHRRTYLLERFDISYQYAASFLQSRRLNSAAADRPNLDRMLSVAPFDGPASVGGYAPLTASRQEVSQLAGQRLTSRQGTKANFLAIAAQYPVIHLATHAVADNADPTRSYVAFYPTPHASNRLYAHEISYGALPETDLVFLSACETASGKLVQGEGIMSLSRAFSLAGCANLVTSLWKAEDNATAYISRQFYVHVREGLPFSKALRQAKLDLLHDRRQVQFHSPQYWSHLIFVGTPPHTGVPVRLWLFIGAGTLLLGWLMWRCRSVVVSRWPVVRTVV